MRPACQKMRSYVNGERVKRFHGSDARIYVHGERTKMCIVQSYTRASVEETEKGERSRGSWENLGSVRRRKTMEQRSNRLMKYNRRCLCFFWILKRNRLHERRRTHASPTNRFKNSDRSNDTAERYKKGQIRIEKFRSSRDNWSGDFTEIPFLSLERHFHRGGQHSSRETAILADVIAGRR